MRLLVAPDKFRGTLTAREAGEAIARGWRRARPDDDVVVVPLADGGEGTLDVLAPTDDPAATRSMRTVTGPLGDPVEAAIGMRGETAVIEMARASGLELVPAARRAPMRTTTRGTGELMAAAIDARARRMLVCLGGSATNDGGVGMAAALGGRFLDVDGRPIGDGGGAVVALNRLDAGPVLDRVRAIEIVGVTDVDNPLCGPRGATVVYGPQKGAGPEDVLLLDRALGHLAAVTERDLGIDLRDEPGAGAAGGLGFGLMAFLGARLRPGVEVVMDAVGLRPRLARADLVITGEGKLDAQSLSGKTVAGVLDAAAEAGVRAAVVCGRAEIAPEGAEVRSLVERFGEGPAMTDTRRCLETLAEELASEMGGAT